MKCHSDCISDVTLHLLSSGYDRGKDSKVKRQERETHTVRKLLKGTEAFLTLYVAKRIVVFEAIPVRGVPVARPYKDVVDLSHLEMDPDLKKFADGVRRQIQAEYQETFGLGEIVAKRRTELHLSQIQLAKNAGVSQAGIRRIECGEGNPILDTLKKIFAALQLQMTFHATTLNRSD